LLLATSNATDADAGGWSWWILLVHGGAVSISTLGYKNRSQTAGDMLSSE